MAYPVAIGSVAQIILDGRMYGQQVMNVLHYKVKGNNSSTDGKALINSLIGLIQANGGVYSKWISCVSVQVTGVTIRGQWITPIRYAPQAATPVIDHGTVAGEVYGVNTACAITRRTDFTGRKERGVLHLPGVPKSFFVDDGLNLDGTAAYGDFGVISLQTLVTGDDDFQFQPILFDRLNPGQAQELTSYEVGHYVRTMHRRTVGLGT